MEVDLSDEGAGPPVILIHGGASNFRQWKTLAAELRSDFRVVAPNMHGAGSTPAWPGPGPYGLADAAALIEQLCRSLPGKVSLVGHSVGGAFAMQAAAQLGERIDKLVLLEPAPYDLLRQAGRGEAYREALALYDVVREGSERGDWLAIAERFLDAFVGSGTWAGMSEERRGRAAQLMRQNRPEWDALMLDRTTLEEWRTRLPRATQLVAAADTWPPLRALTALFVEGFPEWTYVELAEGGHMAPLYRPETVNPRVVAFLRGQVSAATPHSRAS